MGFVAYQAQQEPDLLLANADLALVVADGAGRQPITQPAGRGPQHFDMFGQQAGFFAQLAVHGLDRRLIRVHPALRELPAVPAHPARPEHPAIRAHQHNADVRSVTVRIDHDADS